MKRIFTKALLLILTLTLCFGALAVSTSAAIPQGDGTEKDPYVIRNAEDFAEAVSDTSRSEVHVFLTEDVHLPHMNVNGIYVHIRLKGYTLTTDGIYFANGASIEEGTLNANGVVSFNREKSRLENVNISSNEELYFYTDADIINTTTDCGIYIQPDEELNTMPRIHAEDTTFGGAVTLHEGGAFLASNCNLKYGIMTEYLSDAVGLFNKSDTLSDVDSHYDIELDQCTVIGEAKFYHSELVFNNCQFVSYNSSLSFELSDGVIIENFGGFGGIFEETADSSVNDVYTGPVDDALAGTVNGAYAGDIDISVAETYDSSLSDKKYSIESNTIFDDNPIYVYGNSLIAEKCTFQNSLRIFGGNARLTSCDFKNELNINYSLEDDHPRIRGVYIIQCTLAEELYVVAPKDEFPQVLFNGIELEPNANSYSVNGVEYVAYSGDGTNSWFTEARMDSILSIIIIIVAIIAAIVIIPIILILIILLPILLLLAPVLLLLLPIVILFGPIAIVVAIAVIIIIIVSKKKKKAKKAVEEAAKTE